MRIEIFENEEQVALQAAAIIAREARLAVAKRGIFSVAVSGGSTPWNMLSALTKEDAPWDRVHLFQVDERLAPEGHPDRNLTHLHKSLLGQAVACPLHIHAMRVDLDPFAAIEDYIHKIHDIAGSGAVLDLVHLGLGADGHTASLIPGDAVLEVTTTDVALTAIYQGRQRMTLTYPIINRCRQILWLVTGDGKSEMLERLLKKDSHIPAGRINQDRALVLADMQAAKRI